MKTPVTTTQRKSTPAPDSYKLDTVDSREKNPFTEWDKAILAALRDAPLPDAEQKR
jgi:hypothetical protein